MPAGLERMAAVDGDVILRVTESGALNGQKFTTRDPAPDVGPQKSANADELCKLLTYGGETGWRLLRGSEAKFLIDHHVSLVAGYAGEVWAVGTKKERLDRLVSARENMADQRINSGRQGALAWPAVLETLGFRQRDEFDAQIDKLQRAVDEGNGNEVYTFGVADLTAGTVATNSSAAGPFAVICAK